jgi:hypothetical protein
MNFCLAASISRRRHQHATIASRNSDGAAAFGTATYAVLFHHWEIVAVCTEYCFDSVKDCQGEQIQGPGVGPLTYLADPISGMVEVEKIYSLTPAAQE